MTITIEAGIIAQDWRLHMDWFKSKLSWGPTDSVDLDDPETYKHYEWKDCDVHQLWDACIKEIGYVYMYLNFLHDDVDWGRQPKSFYGFCKWFKEENRAHRSDDTPENRLWFKKFLYKLKDDTENLC